MRGTVWILCFTLFVTTFASALEGDQRRLEDLSPQARKAFLSDRDKALVLVQANQSEKAIVLLRKCQGAADDPVVENLLGACYTKLREFERARKHFRKALEWNGDLHEATFNLAEIDFVDGNYQAAHEAFTKILEDKLFTRKSTLDLLAYKQLLCLLKMEEMSDAKELYAELPDDSLQKAYGKVAVLFARGQTKPAQAALAKLASSDDEDSYAIYVDSLIELGWVDQ